MSVLVLEESERISNLYKKIFAKKNITSYIAKTGSECIQVFRTFFEKDVNFEYVILEKSLRLEKQTRLEDEILEIKPNQKIFFLSPFINYEDEGKISKETFMTVQKPFALVTLLSKLEIEKSRQIIVK